MDKTVSSSPLATIPPTKGNDSYSTRSKMMYSWSYLISPPSHRFIDGGFARNKPSSYWRSPMTMQISVFGSLQGTIHGIPLQYFHCKCSCSIWESQVVNPLYPLFFSNVLHLIVHVQYWTFTRGFVRKWSINDGFSTWCWSKLAKDRIVNMDKRGPISVVQKKSLILTCNFCFAVGDSSCASEILIDLSWVHLLLPRTFTWQCHFGYWMIVQKLSIKRQKIERSLQEYWVRLIGYSPNHQLSALIIKYRLWRRPFWVYNLFSDT